MNNENTKNLIQELKARGFIYQYSDDLEEIFSQKRVAYLGVEPTADSAHVGHLVSYIFARHLHRAGFKIILLVGGATGLIGDPSGKDDERTLLSAEEVAKNARKLGEQMKKVVGLDDLEMVNNYDWLIKMGMIEFLRDVGKHFTVNTMLRKESVAKRIERDQGISFTEFSYSLLQGYDFYYLNQEKGVDLQFCGSDQWGNVIAGIELIRRKTGKKVYGLTTPLIIDKNTGKKFGKSEGNAVWLSPEKLSPYNFYQFWLNVDDANVFDYLKIYTFLSLKEIADLEEKMKAEPETGIAQKTLAFEVTKFIHGEESAKASRKVSAILFENQKIDELDGEEEKMLLSEAPVCKISAELDLIEILLKADLAKSKREAREFLGNGAVKIDSEQVSIDDKLPKTGLHILTRGKKNKCVLDLR